MSLKEIRIEQNISQSKLSKMSGVSIRNIQAYEQGQININKASAVSVYSLSKALGCKYEDILDLEK
jgi:transcriptional regulator with XRE-family HTH domain